MRTVLVGTPLLDAANHHCQQAAEKTVKGCLQLQDDRFPKTHDVADVVNQAPPSFDTIKR